MVSTYNTFEQCDSNIGLYDNFDGNGKKVITVSPNENIMPTSSLSVFLVDGHKARIVAGGSMPMMVDVSQDGTFSYEGIDAYSKVKSVYAFFDDKLILKKSTMLVFDGRVCIKTHEGAYSVHVSCENGIEATQKNQYVLNNFMKALLK
jgi:hypothetical protein